MTAWQLIRTHLAADSSVTTLATGGIYPVRGKQSETRPMIIGRQISGDSPDALDATAVHSVATLEIGCIAYQNYDTAVTLFEAVKTSLRAMRKTTVATKRIENVLISGVRDEDNPDIDWFGIIFTVQIRHHI
jgi:hypothetical protein